MHIRDVVNRIFRIVKRMKKIVSWMVRIVINNQNSYKRYQVNQDSHQEGKKPLMVMIFMVKIVPSIVKIATWIVQIVSWIVQIVTLIVIRIFRIFTKIVTIFLVS